jgi:hypothetical protein
VQTEGEHVVKLNVKVPAALDDVIKRVQIRKGGKGRALKELVRLALDDKASFSGKHPFGPAEDESCTLDVPEKDYEASVDYRDKYKLTSKKAYFLHALEHGATLAKADLDAQDTAKAAVEAAKAEAAKDVKKPE